MDQAIPSSETLKAGCIKKEDGKEFIYAYHAGAVVLNTLYRLSSSTSLNPRVVAVATGAVQNKFCVATATDTTAGAWGWFQIKGRVAALVVPNTAYTAADTLKLDAGAIVTTGGAYAGTDNEFAVVLTASASGTALDVYLFGRNSVLGET